MDAEKLDMILRSFPTDKTPLSRQELAERTKSFINNEIELKQHLTFLKAEKYIRLDFEGYAITDNGLDSFAPPMETKENYILRKFLENHGTFNLIHLDGRRFLSSNDRFDTIQSLIRKGWIEKLHGGIGQTHRLTEKYHRDILLFYKQLAIPRLKDTDGKQTTWSTIAKQISIPERYSNDLKNLLISEGLIKISTRTSDGDLIKSQPLLTSYHYGLTENKINPPLENPTTSEVKEENSQSKEMNNEIEKNHEVTSPKWKHVFKQEWYWIIVGGAFALGWYFGINRFDAEKNKMYDDVRDLRQQVNEKQNQRTYDSTELVRLTKENESLKSELNGRNSKFQGRKSEGIIFDSLRNLIKGN